MRGALIGAFVLQASGSAQAGLTLCNDGGSKATVAIAYAVGETWTSEGWWGIAPGECAEVQSGDLTRRHSYYTPVRRRRFCR